MSSAVEYLEDAAHHFVAPLDRLVWIGIGADRDYLGLVAGRRQFLLQQGSSFRLHQKFGFEIEPRRHAEIGVRRAREAVDAAVLAAAIWIDRAVKSDVGRVITGNDFPGRVDRDRRLEGWTLVKRSPAVVKGDARERLITPRGVALGTPPASALVVDDDAKELTDIVIGAHRR